MTGPIETRHQAMSLLESIAPMLRAERERAAYYLPRITETTHRGEREWDIYSRLLKDRIVFIGTEIDDFVANAVIAQFLFLESEDPDKDIQVYINSPGGVVTAGLAIVDTMNYVRCPVSTMCIGQASSMGAVLLAVGEKGRRFALPHARIMIHQPLGGARGQATDIEIQAREIKKVKETLIDLLCDACTQKRDKIANDVERDFYLSAMEAKEYGLIDEVLSKPKAPKEKKG
jgi:ATP-dependent Clp protease protease subunit